MRTAELLWSEDDDDGDDDDDKSLNFMFEEFVTARLDVSRSRKMWTLHVTGYRNMAFVCYINLLTFRRHTAMPSSGQNPNVGIFPLPYTASVGPAQLSQHRDLLRAGRSGDRIPVTARFSAPVNTGPGAHPASCTMDTGSLSPGVKRPERGVAHPPPSSAEVK